MPVFKLPLVASCTSAEMYWPFQVMLGVILELLGCIYIYIKVNFEMMENKMETTA